MARAAIAEGLPYLPRAVWPRRLRWIRPCNTQNWQRTIETKRRGYGRSPAAGRKPRQRVYVGQYPCARVFSQSLLDVDGSISPDECRLVSFARSLAEHLAGY